MIRKTLTILSLLGLLLSVALWGVSYLNLLYYSNSGLALIQGGVRWSDNADGLLGFSFRHATGSVITTGKFSREPETLLLWLGPSAGDMSAPDIMIRKGQWVCCGYSNLGTSWLPILRLACGYLVIPFWIPAAFFASLFLLSLVPVRRRRKRKKLGLCLQCGYDLRGSKDRCPECGAPFDEKLLAAFHPVKNGNNHRGLKGPYARVKAALFPELQRFETQTELRAAWKSANRKVLLQPLYWLCLASLIPAMAGVASFVSVFALLILFLAILLVWTYMTFVLVARRTIQQTLRKRLIEGGVAICLKCGYDLRGSKDRCPECGTEFGTSIDAR